VLWFGAVGDTNGAFLHREIMDNRTITAPSHYKHLEILFSIYFPNSRVCIGKLNLPANMVYM